MACLSWAQCGGPKLPDACLRFPFKVETMHRLRTGRTVAGNRDQGHIQDRARKLTSPAFGRAILQDSRVRVIRDLPANKMRCAAYRAKRHRDAATSEIGMNTLVMLAALTPGQIALAIVILCVLMSIGPLILGSVF